MLIVGVKSASASVKKNSHGPSVSHLHQYFDRVEIHEALVVLEFILVASKNELLLPVDSLQLQPNNCAIFKLTTHLLV